MSRAQPRGDRDREMRHESVEVGNGRGYWLLPLAALTAFISGTYNGLRLTICAEKMFELFKLQVPWWGKGAAIALIALLIAALTIYALKRLKRFKLQAPSWNKRTVIALMAFLVVALSITEWIFAYHSVGVGLVLALFLTILIYLLTVLGKLPSPYLECTESLALIPLYILFTSSLPWFFLKQELLLPAVYAVILALCFWHIYDKGLSLKELGFHFNKWPKYIMYGFILGMPLGTIEFFILRIAPSAPTFQWSNLVRDFVYMVFFVGLGEELLFRALIQKDLGKAFGWKWGLFLSSFLFMVMHLTWRSVPELFFVFGAAVVLGIMYQKTGSMVGITVLHGAGNTMLVAVMPYLLRTWVTG